jgi:hypothetical protein
VSIEGDLMPVGQRYELRNPRHVTVFSPDDDMNSV